MVALADCKPAAMKTESSSARATAALELAMRAQTPPAGAGDDNCTGSDRVAASGTLSVGGRLIRLSETGTTSVSGVYPGADATTFALPSVRPLTSMVRSVWPTVKVTLPGAAIESRAGASLTTETTSPPAGAGCSSRTLSVPARSKPTTLEPSTASSIAGGGSTPVAVIVAGVSPSTLAVMLLRPGVAPSVQLPSVAWPLASVTAFAPVREPAPPETANVTVAPGTGTASASMTRTTTGVASGCETYPVCAFPPRTVMNAAPPLPTSNGAVVALASPAALATIVYPEPTALTFHALKVATPATAATRTMPPSEAPAGFTPKAMVTLSVKAGTGTPAASRACTRSAGVVFAPTTCSALIGCVIASCVATSGGSAALAVTTSEVTPAAATVTLCVPTRLPSVQVNAACPLESVVRVAAEMAPPPVETPSVRATPDIAAPSVATRRTRTESERGAPAGAVCAPPETTESAEARGVMSSTAVSGALPPASCTAIRATPRASRAVPAPAPGAVIRARVVSSEAKTNGAALTTDCCASRAMAVKMNGDPASTVRVSGAIDTLTACAPGPVYVRGTATGCGGVVLVPSGTARTSTGPPRKTVSPTTFMYARVSARGSPPSVVPLRIVTRRSSTTLSTPAPKRAT